MKKFFILLLLIFTVGTLTSVSQERSVTITIYHPSEKQTQGNPLVTASGYKITRSELKNGNLRICAISRKLHKKYGGPYDFGDTIYVSCGDSRLDGYWVIQDLMGPKSRHKNMVDLLVDSAKIKTGSWRGKIRKK